MNDYTISERGLELIKKHEGCKLKAYKCSAGVWTIGVGHTLGVREGDVITQKQADKLLRDDVAATELGLKGLVKPRITQNMFDALVSLVFNIGIGNFAKSTVLREINNADFAAAAEAFLMWNRGGSKVLPGLVRRRKEEHDLFLEGSVPHTVAANKKEKRPWHSTSSPTSRVAARLVPSKPNS